MSHHQVGLFTAIVHAGYGNKLSSHSIFRDVGFVGGRGLVMPLSLLFYFPCVCDCERHCQKIYLCLCVYACGSVCPEVEMGSPHPFFFALKRDPQIEQHKCDENIRIYWFLSQSIL